ncbi:MAG: choice-of-anchor J domain-containing protein [Bacteroidales bacterium]|nr:choice-of-anchor J domain-containing protein [Bacteroidales bacterium]
MKKFLLTLMLMVMFAPFALHADDIAGMSRTSFAKDEVRSYTNYWTPDETVYPNNMTLTGLVTIDDEIQNTTSLEVGAFCGEELRGSYRLQYIPALDKHLVFLVIYGNDNDEITFKLYDHDLGQELDYQMLPESVVNFEVNKVEGDADFPFVIAFQEIEYATSFFFDFNDGTTTGWRDIDQDGDAHSWFISEYDGVGGTPCIMSETYSFNVGAFYPDNYFVTTDAYQVAAGSKLIWDVRPYDAVYYSDHYAVVVSTDNETFTNVWEETLTSFSNFEQRILDLSDYAGQNIYIGFRHYNCNGSNATAVLIDNVELSQHIAISAIVNPEEAGTVNGAGVYRNGETATLIATANEGYQFVNWTENGEIVSEDAEYSFVVESARELVANFELQTFNVTVVMQPNLNYELLNEGFETGHYVLPEGWTNYSDPSTAHTWGNIQVQGSFYNYMACTGEYSALQLGGYADNGSLYYLVTPAIDFSSTLNPTISFNYICPTWAGAYNNVSVKYGDTPTGPWTTVWEGAEAEAWTEVSASLAECSGKIVYVAFCVLENQSWGAGIDDVVITNPSCGYITGCGSYQYGETATLTATANDGYQFVSWTESDTIVSTDAEYSFTVESSREFVANFEELPEYASYFFDDFNDHNFDGWRTIDQDSDGHTWRIPNRKSYILSESYDDSNNEELDPDNYIVTTELYKITEKSVLGWLVMPSDDEYYEDHYAVVISTDNETFDVIWEETLTSFNDFEQRVLNLNEYAGQNIYIGFRHYNCNGSTAAGVLIDDVELSAIYNVTANVNPEEAGTVNGAGSYQYGGTATLTATANVGWQFVNWTENDEVVSEDAEYSFEVTEDRVIVANFIIAVYNVTAMPNDEFAGTVSGAGEFLFGETATLTAIANEGYLFANWTENDTVVSEDAEFSFTVTMNRNLVANFEQTVYETAFFDDFNDGNIDGWRLFQNDSDTENWKPVTSVGIDGTSCITSYSYNGAYLHPDNYIVTKLKYAITESSLFAFASRPADGGYYRDKYGVVISEDGQDWTVVWSEQFNEYYSDYRYKYVDLSKYAGQKVYIGLRHYECSGEDANNVLIDNIGLVDGPSVVVVSANPEDAGTVGGAGEYLFGETATLTAYANYGYQFVNWTENGGIVSENAEYYFTVVEDRELVANFEEIVLHEITANANPEDAGIVDGTGEYIHGETATLTAYANPGYKFANWMENGEVVSEYAEYSFVVESARELVANFEEVGLIEITAIVNPEETGTVDGTGEYLYGETATLTAIANDGYQFANWTENGEVVSKDAEYSFIVESARELVANFALPETAFFDDFNDGNIDGWTLIDVDGDGYNWEIYNSTSITSYSYQSGNRNPDNYIVTRLKYSITENSVLVFTSRPCVQSYYKDKYGVVVSEDGQDWTVLWSEQFNEYYSDYRYKYVDLSEYAGKAVYIGFRHYDTDANQAENVLVDDVELTTEYVKFIGEGSWSDASNWLNSQKPESTDKVFVNGNAVIQNGVNVSVNELYISNGSSLTIEGGASLSVAAGFINYDKDALIINDGAQLFQSNENVYATFNKNIVNPVGTWGEDDNTGWHFVSTPIINSQVSEFVPSTGNYDLFKYDGTQTEQWVNYKQHQANFGTTFVQGAAYLASYETETTAVFKGIVSYNQSFDFNVSYNNDVRMANFHLLGNPFSFNMDLKNLELDGVYPAFATLDSVGGYINNTTGIISVGEGFFIEATGEYPSISYNAGSKSRGEKYEYINVVASGKQGSNNVIIKLSGKEEKGFSKLENLNQSIADLYVKNNGRQYSVLGYDRDVKEVELFFDAKEMGNYSISIEPNGKFESVTLVDRMTGIETNMLIEDKYTFTATANDNPNRFVLKLSNGQEPTEDSQFAYMNNGDIVIYNISGDAQINIFDALGRCVYQGESSDATTRIASVYSAGVYVIQKVDDNGVNVQKLIINE